MIDQYTDVIPTIVYLVTKLNPAACNYFSTIDDEDELLYGDSDVSMTMGISLGTTVVKEVPKTEEPMETDTVPNVNVTPTYWAAFARENGTLEVILYSYLGSKKCQLN